jgi:hypothetical protein
MNSSVSKVLVCPLGSDAGRQTESREPVCSSSSGKGGLVPLASANVVSSPTKSKLLAFMLSLTAIQCPGLMCMRGVLSVSVGSLLGSIRTWIGSKFGLGFSRSFFFFFFFFSSSSSFFFLAAAVGELFVQPPQPGRAAAKPKRTAKTTSSLTGAASMAGAGRRRDLVVEQSFMRVSGRSPAALKGQPPLARRVPPA